MRNLGIFATAEERRRSPTHAPSQAPRGRRHAVRGGPFFRPEEAGPRRPSISTGLLHCKSRVTMLLGGTREVWPPRRAGSLSAAFVLSRQRRIKNGRHRKPGLLMRTAALVARLAMA